MFARRCEALLAPVGYHVALAGSVLHRVSGHDLDLIIFPHDSTRRNRAGVYAALESIGMTRFASRAKVTAHWRARGSADRKWVEVWRWRDRRVDLFFLC